MVAYAECLQPCNAPDGVPALRVAAALKFCRPRVYNQVMDFAEAYDLEVISNG